MNDLKIVRIFACFVSFNCKRRSRTSMYAPFFAVLLPRLAGFLATLAVCQVFWHTELPDFYPIAFWVQFFSRRYLLRWCPAPCRGSRRSRWNSGWCAEALQRFFPALQRSCSCAGRPGYQNSSLSCSCIRYNSPSLFLLRGFSLGNR